MAKAPTIQARLVVHTSNSGRMTSVPMPVIHEEGEGFDFRLSTGTNASQSNGVIDLDGGTSLKGFSISDRLTVHADDPSFRATNQSASPELQFEDHENQSSSEEDDRVAAKLHT